MLSEQAHVVWVPAKSSAEVGLIRRIWIIPKRTRKRMNVWNWGNKPGSNINLVRRPNSFSIMLCINGLHLSALSAVFVAKASSKAALKGNGSGALGLGCWMRRRDTNVFLGFGTGFWCVFRKVTEGRVWVRQSVVDSVWCVKLTIPGIDCDSLLQWTIQNSASV